MDHSRINIEAHIQRARELRNEALGKLFSDSWRGFKKLVGRLPAFPATGRSVVAMPKNRAGAM